MARYRSPSGGGSVNVIGAAIGDGRIADHAAKPIVTNAITTAAAVALLHTRSRDRDVTVAAASATPRGSPAASSISRRATAMSGSRRPGSFSRQRRSRRRMLSGVVAGKCRPVRLTLENRRDVVRNSAAREGHLSGEHFVQDAAERPDVRALVDRLPPRLFGTHVRRRPQQHAFVRTTNREGRRLRQIGSCPSGLPCPSCPRLREPKVEHLDRSGRRDRDVGRLQIPVDDALLVRRFERFRDLSRDRERFSDRDQRATP